MSTPNMKKGQEGLAIVLVLFFTVVAGVIGFVSYERVKRDFNETARSAKMAKSKFAAEAAAYMGLAIAGTGSGSVCVTHGPDGKTKATGPGSCAAADLGTFHRVYAKGDFYSYPSTGWLVNTPGDTAEALTSSLKEKLEIKIWQPDASTLRVVGRATVDGNTSDVQVFGEWSL